MTGDRYNAAGPRDAYDRLVTVVNELPEDVIPCWRFLVGESGPDTPNTNRVGLRVNLAPISVAYGMNDAVFSSRSLDQGLRENEPVLLSSMFSDSGKFTFVLGSITIVELSSTSRIYELRRAAFDDNGNRISASRYTLRLTSPTPPGDPERIYLGCRLRSVNGLPNTSGDFKEVVKGLLLSGDPNRLDISPLLIPKDWSRTFHGLPPV